MADGGKKSISTDTVNYVIVDWAERPERKAAGIRKKLSKHLPRCELAHEKM